MIQKYADILIKARITVPDESDPAFFPITVRQDRLALALQEAQDEEREHIACYLISQGHDRQGRELLAGMHRPINWDRVNKAAEAWLAHTI